MFTCCPNCKTVFKVSAKHLQQAAGQVRCGRCDFSFNALNNLQESASEAAANLPAPADQGEDAGAAAEKAVDDLDAASEEQTATPDAVVLVEDVEAFEAAVLATIHATESKAWESSGPHFVGNIGADEPEEETPAADEDDAWLSNEAQDTDDTDREADPDQPSMDFLERMAEGADEEADLEDVNVDDEDESQELADDDLLEDEDADESAATDDDSLPEDDETDEPEVVADDELLEEEDEDEAEALTDDGLPENEREDEAEALADDELPENDDEDKAEALADDELLGNEDVKEPAGAADDSLPVDDKHEALVDDELLEDEDADEPAEAADHSLTEGDDIAEPVALALADDELLENEDADEPAELVDDLIDDGHDDETEPPPAEEPGEEESATQDSVQDADEADVAQAAGGSDGGVEEIWLGEVTLESAEKDELEFDVPGDQVDTVFMAADEEPPPSDTGAEKEDGSENGSLEELFDSHAEGAEEIVLASEEALDLTVSEAGPELPSAPVATKDRRFALAKKYHRPAAIAGAVVLTFMLLAQLTHSFRYQILESGSFGPLLESVYRGLGAPLTRQWDLDAYDIRRTRVVANETGTGVVEISAILTNRASFAQPYPILRLIFTDQWDEALAIRDLTAGEYLQTDPDDQARMVAGEQVAVDIRVMELADDLAQNYHIEYCLQDSNQNLRCK